MAGNEYNGSHYFSKYWKNGVSTVLTDGTTDSRVSSISVFCFFYLSGSDIYVAGYEEKENGITRIAKYWKNGVAIVLSDGTMNNYATSIFVKEK